MSKKVIVALLAVVMALSVFSLSVFAVGGFSDESTADLKTYNYTQTWSLSTPELVSGSTYRVKVYLQTNYLVGPVQFKLENVSGVTATLGGGYYTGSKISSNASGLVVLIPSTASTLVGQRFETPTEIAVVTYTKGAQDPAIQNNPYTLTNPEGTLMAARLSGSTAVNGANYVFGQKVVVEGGSVTPPAGGNADLALTSVGSSSGVVIDTSKKFANTYDGVVMGIPAIDNGSTPITQEYYQGFFEATNGGSVVVQKSIYSGRSPTWGTGTVIKVNDANSSLAKTYIVVIFGDISGDGLIENADIGLALGEYEKKGTPLTEVKKLAANCYIPGRATGQDAADALYLVENADIGLILRQYELGNAYDFAKLAAKHKEFNYYYQ